MSKTLTERGLDIFGELMGPEAKAGMAQVISDGGFGSDVAELACKFAFAEVWGRDGLERKQRSLVTLGALIALGRMDELKNHMHIGLNNGLTAKELEEVVIQSIPYVGMPAAVQALHTASAVLKERA